MLMLMRRLRWWMIGLAGLAVIGVVVAALLTGRPQFRFLEGQTPVPMVRAEASSMGFTDTDAVYSFRADFEDLKQRAEEELRARGYVRDFGVHGIQWVSTTRSGWSTVTLSPDMRITEVSNLGWKSTLRSEPGWVTVWCQAWEGSFWDRLKGLVGL